MSKYRKTVDEANLTLTIERRFGAPKDTVWDCYTKADLIEKWWGPEGFPTTIKTFDFRVGGTWHYHMTGPDGSKYWSLVEYKAIETGSAIEYDDFFSDENGSRSATMPTLRGKLVFRADDADTLVTTQLKFTSLDDLRKLVEMGFEEGYASQCDKLDRLLSTQATETARISVEVTVDAPIAEVWRAYTTPNDIMQWNTASDDWHTPSASVNLKAGGTFTSRMEAKDGSMGFDFEGTYTEIVENELIEYEFGGRKAQVVFTQGADGVMVRVTFDGETTHSIDDQRNGWQAILNNFKRHVE